LPHAISPSPKSPEDPAGQSSGPQRHLKALDQEVLLRTGTFLASAMEIGRWWSAHAGVPVYLDEVAKIVDGPEEPENLCAFRQKRQP
jgi:multidrug efflux pump subunit AcrB